MDKTIRIGTGPYGSTFCRIEFNDGKLSITGVEGPKRNGNARGSCGQIIMGEWEFTSYAPGWNPELVARFREVWNRWHRNDMRAGSPAQRAYLEAHPITDRAHHYEQTRDSLRAAGLNPDPGYTHNGKPYSYGSAWLREEVPAGVIAFLESLPDTDITPAWV